jgi:DNA repair ATPase RecN
VTTEAEARRQLEERRRLIDAKLRSLHEQEYLLRMEERRLPTNAELARKYGVSSRTILAATAGRLPKRYA